MTTWRTRRDWQQMKITRGALAVLIAELVVSVGWLLAGKKVQAEIAEWLVAAPSTVFREGHVWTLVTSPLVELDFIQLVMTVLVMWMFVPTLERFWGMNRFLRFCAITSVVGSLGGTLVGYALHNDVPIAGLSPFMYAAIVAFGILYAKQPVEFSFYIRLTGRQLMYGFIGFLTLFVVLTQAWEKGASFAAAMVAAAVMTSKNLSPGLRWRRWQIERAKRKLGVIDGGLSKKPKRPDERYLN